MSSKKRLMVILACIAVAVVVTLLWVSTLKSAQPKLTEVVAVTKPIIRGYPFIQDQLSIIKVDSSTVSKDMVLKKEDLLNKFATRDIDPSVPVLKDYAGDSFAIRSLSEGMVPVRIPVDSRSQGGVIPGDRANIIVTHLANKDTGTGAYSEILAYNVKVLSLLYDAGAMQDEKTVKDNTAAGKDPVAGGGSTSTVTDKITSIDGKYPSLVTMEVIPAVSMKVQNLIAEKAVFAIELDPWRYDQIHSLKDAIDKKTGVIIKFFDGGAKPLTDFQTEYTKILDLKKELLLQNGGIGYEKDFFLKLVRSQIAIVEKIPTTDQASKDYVIKDINDLAQELSDLNSGWWKIEDEISTIRKYVEGLGGKLNVNASAQGQASAGTTAPAVSPTPTPPPSSSNQQNVSPPPATNGSKSSSSTSSRGNSNDGGVLIIK